LSDDDDDEEEEETYDDDDDEEEEGNEEEKEEEKEEEEEERSSRRSGSKGGGHRSAEGRSRKERGAVGASRTTSSSDEGRTKLQEKARRAGVPRGHPRDDGAARRRGEVVEARSDRRHDRHQERYSGTGGNCHDRHRCGDDVIVHERHEHHGERHEGQERGNERHASRRDGKGKAADPAFDVLIEDHHARRQAYREHKEQRQHSERGPVQSMYLSATGGGRNAQPLCLASASRHAPSAAPLAYYPPARFNCRPEPHPNQHRGQVSMVHVVIGPGPPDADEYNDHTTVNTVLVPERRPW